MKIKISLSEAPVLDAEDWDKDFKEKQTKRKPVSLTGLQAQIDQEKEFQLARTGNEGDHHKIWK